MSHNSDLHIIWRKQFWFSLQVLFLSSETSFNTSSAIKFVLMVCLHYAILWISCLTESVPENNLDVRFLIMVIKKKKEFTFCYLGKIHTELFKRLQQTGITYLFNNKDTLGRFVPCQPLACWILNVPREENTM
mgnify:CR=1 FL=1